MKYTASSAYAYVSFNIVQDTFEMSTDYCVAICNLPKRKHVLVEVLCNNIAVEEII